MEYIIRSTCFNNGWETGVITEVAKGCRSSITVQVRQEAENRKGTG